MNDQPVVYVILTTKYRINMTHTYTVDGITCDGCVAKVKHKLLLHPDITAADVQLDGGNTSVTMQRHISVDELQDAIGRDSKYTIREDVSRHHPVGSNTEEDTRSWFSTYKPILLIFAFITVISLITSTGNGAVNGMTFMSTFMGGFFLVFSFFKLLDLDGFADSYAMYDIVAMRFRSWGYIYAFIELALGLAYAAHFNPFLTNIATLVVMSVSLTGVLKSLLDKRKIRCACLGAVFNLPMSTVTAVEDALMIVMSAMMLFL